MRIVNKGVLSGIVLLTNHCHFIALELEDVINSPRLRRQRELMFSTVLECRQSLSEFLMFLHMVTRSSARLQSFHLSRFQKRSLNDLYAWAACNGQNSKE